MSDKTELTSQSQSQSQIQAQPLAPAPSSLAKTKSLKIVLKVGSSSLSTADGKFLHLSTIVSLVETVCSLIAQGHKVIIVTSGAVSIGCQRLGLSDRPSNLIKKQAVAAVGQSRLMRVYDDFFSHRNQPIAQVLLSRENLSKRHHYTNALNTFNELLNMNIVPIVNENDTVAVEELRVGDNDTLSALVASLVEADWLFLLTDVDALYTADPRSNPQAKPIHVVNNLDELRDSVNTNSLGGSGWGTGGMATKLQASRIATTGGVTTGIIKSDCLSNIFKMMNGELVGTRFCPSALPIKGKKKWIAFGTQPAGTLVLDDGAVNAILSKKSLFGAGIISVSGNFQAQSSVLLVDLKGKELGRGVTNYASDEIATIRGMGSSLIEEVLGYVGPDEIIHRENLALTDIKSHQKNINE